MPSLQDIFPQVEATAVRAARRETQTLRARAQRAVELAIEQGEPAALTLLDIK